MAGDPVRDLFSDGAGDGLDGASELRRHECECRFWLDQGVRTKAQMEDLMRRITKHRGAEAAERLRQGMVAERDRRTGK